jgi:hypothetical protein
MNILSTFDIYSLNDNGMGLLSTPNTTNMIYGGLKKKPIKKINTKKKSTKSTKPKKSNKPTINEDSESESEEEIVKSEYIDKIKDDLVDTVNLYNKQDEFKVSDILREPVIGLNHEELINQINEFYEKYVKFVDLIHDHFPNIRVPLFIKEEPNIELKLLHILNELRKITTLLKSPLILTDYHKTNEIKLRNKELFARKPISDNSVYVQTITNLGTLDINELKKLVNKYNYIDLFKVMKFKYSKTSYNIEPLNNKYCKRYWINNMEQYKNLVYDKSVYYKKLDKNTGINPVYIDLTNTIIYQNDSKIQNDLKRIANKEININSDIKDEIKQPQTTITSEQENNSTFINAYNKYVEDKIKLKIVRCVPLTVKSMINITDQLIGSININNLINNSLQMPELIDKVLSDVRIFLVDVLYNMNTSVKNKRELYFANAKIIFDITKNIKSNLKIELYSQDIKFPIDTFEKKNEAYGKLKNVISKVINDSGVKTIGRSAEQTICI